VTQGATQGMARRHTPPHQVRASKENTWVRLYRWFMQ
jgi:hypothetical protein